MLCAVKVLNSQVVEAKGEALLVGDLPDAGVGPLTTLQLPLLRLLQSINLKVIGGSEPELLPYVVVPGEGGAKLTYLVFCIIPCTLPTTEHGQTCD